MVSSVHETERWDSRNKDVTDELLTLKQRCPEEPVGWKDRSTSLYQKAMLHKDS